MFRQAYGSGTLKWVVVKLCKRIKRKTVGLPRKPCTSNSRENLESWKVFL